MKIGIVCSKNYHNQTVLLRLISYIKDNIGFKNCTIVSAANGESDKFIRKIFIENEFEYKEFNPAYTGQNQFSYEPESYFKKNFHISHLYDRYMKLFRYVDYLFIFKLKNDTDQVFNDVIKKIPKKVKVIMYEK